MFAVAELVAAAAVAAVVLLLVWSEGFHRGWRKARRAEVERQRERQRRLAETTGRRPRRTQRL